MPHTHRGRRRRPSPTASTVAAAKPQHSGTSEWPGFCRGDGLGMGYPSSNFIGEDNQAPRDVAPAGSILYKTKLCKFFLLGNCERGSKCTFAHNKDQLSSAPDLFKTKLCRMLLETGKCNNPQCRFAHRNDEIRVLDRHSVNKIGPLPDRLASVLPIGPVPPRQLTPAPHAHMMSDGLSNLQNIVAPSPQAHMMGDDLSNLQNIVAQASVPIEVRRHAALALLDQSLSMLGQLQSQPEVNQSMKQYVSGHLAKTISFLQSIESQQNQQLDVGNNDGSSPKAIRAPFPLCPGSECPTRSSRRSEDGGVGNREMGSKFGDMAPVSECEPQQHYAPAKFSKFNMYIPAPSSDGPSDGGQLADHFNRMISQQTTSLGDSEVGSFDSMHSLMDCRQVISQGVPEDESLDEFGDFSRQTTEFESVPPWSRQISAWNGHPSQQAAKDVGTENISSDRVLTDYSKFAKELEDVLEKELELPNSSFKRQMSVESTGSSVFETSNALGLRCYIKNTFLDVDPLSEQTKKPLRKTRSVSPPLRCTSKSPSLSDELDLMDAFSRQMSLPCDVTCR